MSYHPTGDDLEGSNKDAVNKSHQSPKKQSFSINIGDDDDKGESEILKNNSVKKVRLKDTQRIRSKSAGDPYLDKFPIKHYSNEDALRMSEERLLARLKDGSPRESNNHLAYDSDYNKHHKHYENVDTEEEELERNEESDEFLDNTRSTPIKFPTTRSSPISKPRPPTLFNAKYVKGGSIGSSSIWMSHDNDTDYSRHECVAKCSSRLHIAVKTGNVDEIEILLEIGENPNAKDCSGRTPLHWAVNSGCNCDQCTLLAVKSTQLLVDSPKTDIDIQDNNGETALHLAAENQSTKCASILLYRGADHSIKSKSGVKALAVMIEKIPEAMDSLLNRAVSIEKYDPTNVKCELRLDFGAIVGYPEARSLSQRNASAKQQQQTSESNNNGCSKAKKEMQLLTLILDCSSSARNKMLTHPLIGIFLHLKWMKIKTMFWATILLHVVLLLLYTVYILDVYLISCPYRPKITEPAAVKAAKAEGNYLQSDNSTYRAEFIKFSWFEFSPQLQELGTIKSNLYEGCPLEIGPTVKSVLLLVLTIVMVTNEIFKMLPAPRAYWKRMTNRMQWGMFFFVFITSWPVFMSHPNISFWQYQAAAFGLFLAWCLMLTQIGKFPILGLYVEILTKVLKNFGFFMITYASLLIAFALAFCVLFPGNAPYSSIPLAILKVLMMMVGEVNYEDLFYGNEENPVDDLLYPITGHVLYGAFVIMITIVLMNLLVGLTVSDIQRRQFCIQGLQRDAELTRLCRQIGEIAQLESFVFSKRLQSSLPRSFAAFLRDSILVVPTQRPQSLSSPKGLREENWFFQCRPNDPNDKSIPEDLKASIIKLAASRHRNRRTNRCSRIVNRIPMTSILEEYQASIQASTTPIMESNPVSWPPPTSYPIRPEDNAERDHGQDTAIKPILQYPLTIPSSTPNSNSTSVQQINLNFRDANEMMKRLEEKIIDRMKIQIDALYQKIEDRMSTI